jgi:hypothetical protein
MRNEPATMNLNYFIDLLQTAGIDFKKLTDGVWNQAETILKEVPANELVFSGTKEQKIGKIIQMGAFKILKDEPDHELILQAFSLKHFIKSAFTEAMLYDSPLMIPDEKEHHLKVLKQAITEGKTIPKYVLDEYPELQQSAPKINLLKMKMKAKALKLKLKLN